MKTRRRTLLEDLGSHVAWGSTNLGKEREAIIIHNARETEVGNHDVRIFSLGTEQQVLRLEITMHDTSGVNVLNSQHDGANKLGSICLVVVALGADTVEELAASA